MNNDFRLDDDDELEYSGLSLDDDDTDLTLSDNLDLSIDTSSNQQNTNTLGRLDLNTLLSNDSSLDDDLTIDDDGPLTLSSDDDFTIDDDGPLTLSSNEVDDFKIDDDGPLVASSDEDDMFTIDDDGDLVASDNGLTTSDRTLSTSKLSMGTSTTSLDDDDELVIYDDDMFTLDDDDEPLVSEESVEEKKIKEKANAIERRQKAQKKYRRNEKSLFESISYIKEHAVEFDSSYNGYFAQLEFGGDKKDKTPDLVQYGEATKLSTLVREWSGNIIATFRNKLENAITRNESYSIKELMELNLKEVNINKAYEMPSLTYVKDLFENEIEYNDYCEFLNRYKADIELRYARGSKDRINKLALAAKYRDMYFPILNNVEKALYNLSALDDFLEALTFVEKINIDEDTFVCGHCSEETDYDIPFFDFYFIPEGGEKGEIGLVLGALNKCDYCGKYNMLSAEELKALNRLYTQSKGIILDNLGEFLRRRRHDSFGFAKYENGYEEITDTVPSLLNREELEDEIVEEVMEIPDLTQAILRYKELLDHFSGLKHVSASSVINAEEERKERERLEIKMHKPGAELGRYFDEVTDVVPDKLNLVSLEEIEKYEVTAKLMCSVVSADYNERKINAINSLINHLQTSKYGRYLRYSDMISIYGICQSKGIVEELENLDGYEFVGLAMDCYSSLALGKRFTDLDKQPKDVVIANIKEGFRKVEKEYNRYLELREIYLRDIKDSINDLGQIYISNTNVSDEIKEDYLQDDDVRMLLDLVSNRMIMNDTAEDFFQAWFTCYRHDANKSINKVSRNKSFMEIKDFTGVALTFTLKLEHILKPMDSHKKSLFKHARNIPPVIYPDAEMSKTLDKFLKLKLKMDTDEYETLVALNEILDAGALRNRVLNKYLERIMKECSIDIGRIVKKYGKESTSRLKYYFEGIFTPEEIEEGYDEFMDYLRINKIVERLPNESFRDYMERYKDLGRGEYNYIIRDSELLEKLRESYVFLDACNVISSTITDVGATRKVEFKVAMNTILNALLAHYNKDDIIDILGYEPFIVNGLLNNIEPMDFYKFKYTFSEFRLVLRASSYLYNSPAINTELSDAGLDISKLEGILKGYASELETIGSHIKNIGDVHELIIS